MTTRRPFNMTALLSSACHSRWLGFACCLLTLLSGVDSNLLMPVSSGSLAPVSQGTPSQEGTNDDEMLNLSGSTVGLKASRKKTPFRSVVLSLKVAIQTPRSVLSAHRVLFLATPVCEHQYRNGIGAPLLC